MTDHLHTVHFGFQAGEAFRTIFSVIENKKNGEITIPLKSDLQARLPGLGRGSLLSLELREQHYSIHPSRSSVRGINFIHHTMIYEDGSKDGRKVDTAHVTHAIKRSDGNFAALFIRRCSDLRSDHFKSNPPDTKCVNLGTLDCDHFTPIYMLLATHPDNQLDPFGLEDSNMTELRLKNVKLIVIWTFVSLPSHMTSLTGHVLTIKPADPTAPLDEGMTTEQFIRYFEIEREKLEKELRDFHLARLQFRWGSTLLIPTLRFFRDGSAPTAKSRQYMVDLAQDW